jgi:hypothetical protein
LSDVVHDERLGGIAVEAPIGFFGVSLAHARQFDDPEMGRRSGRLAGRSVDRGMKHRSIARAKCHQRRRWCEQSISVVERFWRGIAIICPSIGSSGMKGKCRTRSHDHGAIGKYIRPPMN